MNPKSMFKNCKSKLSNIIPQSPRRNLKPELPSHDRYFWHVVGPSPFDAQMPSSTSHHLSPVIADRWIETFDETHYCSSQIDTSYNTSSYTHSEMSRPNHGREVPVIQDSHGMAVAFPA